MSLLISCDRYYITNDGNITIPISTDDAAHIGAHARYPWVTVSDDITSDPSTSYDREESIEDVMRVSAAFAHTPDIYLVSPIDFTNGFVPRYATRYTRDARSNNDTHSGTHSVCVSLLSDTTTIDPAARVIGPLGNHYGSIVADTFSRPDRYTFKSHLQDFFGRNTVVVDTQDMHNTDIDALAYLVENNAEVFVKNALDKGPTGIISTTSLHRLLNSDDLNTATYEGMLAVAITENPVFEHWAWGLPRYIFVQEPLSMQYETRFFYVDGKCISASGRIIDLVPDEHSVRDPFCYADHAVVHHSHSNDGQVPVRNPHYQDMYSLAQQISTTWSQHEENALTCVVDIAWDADSDSAVLVELNGISNAGHYGASAHAIYAALLDTTDGYQGLNYGAMRGALDELRAKTHT